MANPEHLEILLQGWKVWNTWRAKQSELTVIDLRGAQLKDANLNQADLNRSQLSGADLSNADLGGSNLCGADLSRADLTFARFYSANLTGADLSFADLSYSYIYFANLSDVKLFYAQFRGSQLRGSQLRRAQLRNARFDGATLTRANLVMANLSGTDFSGTYLDGADFTDAELGYGSFGNTDLSQVKGLETVKHGGPSTIGIDTIYKSRGQIPEIFLRGCGVPEDFITYMRSLVAHPIQFYSCFISYSSKDQDFADRLYADLQNKGVRCWFAPEDLKIGDRFRDRIDESIRLHDKLLVILSENSASSQWVGDEVEAAFERERRENRTVLFPLQIDNAITESITGWAAAIRRTRHIGDFREWKNNDPYQKSFDRLLRDLKAVNKTASS